MIGGRGKDLEIDEERLCRSSHAGILYPFSHPRRTWNLPVHQFLVRHVYFPLLRWVPRPPPGALVASSPRPHPFPDRLFSSLFNPFSILTPAVDVFSESIPSFRLPRVRWLYRIDVVTTTEHSAWETTPFPLFPSLYPAYRAGASKMTANVTVFAVSAFFHELLISVGRQGSSRGGVEKGRERGRERGREDKRSQTDTFS